MVLGPWRGGLYQNVVLKKQIFVVAAFFMYLCTHNNPTCEGQESVDACERWTNPNM